VAPTAATEGNPRFLFISSSQTSEIKYITLPNLAAFVDDESNDKPEDVEKTTLISGLSAPAGLAVWQGKDNAYLYVADVGQSKILAYELFSSIDLRSVTAGSATTVASDLSHVYGLALDGFGNLYFALDDGSIGVLNAENGVVSSGATKTMIYTTSSSSKVSKPAALAADAFYVYWGNTDSGATTGSVVKAFERDAEKLKTTYPDYPKALAKNSDKAMGVCLARTNVFYTGESQTLFGVSSDGGTPVEISHGFQSPRGCAYDGDNTLYVADSDGGAIYSLPGNFLALRAVNRLTKIATSTSPENVAIFSSSSAYVQAEGGFFSWFR
jgi:hypothetical protein